MKSHALKVCAVLVVGVALCAPALAAERDAERAVKQAREIIQAGLERREIQARFQRLVDYSGELLDASAGDRTFSDKTGNCRLAWMDGLLRRPLESMGAAEKFTHDLHELALRDGTLHALMSAAAVKLDADWPPAGTPASTVTTPDDALHAVAEAVGRAKVSFERSLAPLTDEERAELRAGLFQQSTGGLGLGHRFADRDAGRRVCDLLEKMDRRALLQAGDALAGLADPALLEQLAALPAARKLDTPAGAILVGGPGPDEYDLDAMPDVCAVVDLGGDDVYIEGTVSAARPVLVVIDLGGNDTYRGEKPGIQGAAVLGASLLVDRSGDDSYSAVDVAQGSCVGGIGLLVDKAGDDTYVGDRRVQGQAVGGVGMLIDRSGDDAYRSALLSQGVGGPLGLGMLDDLAGADSYYAGGKYSGGYDDSPGYGSWSQGVGVGPRGVANGGIGVILDGGGDDVYEYDYFGHGGGYWFAVGLARDFGGNDQRVGATRTLFDGSPREVARYVRWGVGYGCHYALAFVFDDEGDDTYRGEHATVSYAWDIGVGAVFDFAGDDRYTSAGSGVAQAHNAALAVLFDARGNDVYEGGSAGVAGAIVDYHQQEKAGGNFTFLIDLGGDDTYPDGVKNDAEHERGWAGGFLIDRPAPLGQ